MSHVTLKLDPGQPSRSHMLPDLSMLAVSAPLTEEQRGEANYRSWREFQHHAQVPENMVNEEIKNRKDFMKDYFHGWTETLEDQRKSAFWEFMSLKEEQQAPTDDEMESESSSADDSSTDIDYSQPMDTLAALQTIIQRQDRQIAAFRHSIQSYQRQSQSTSGGAAEASAIGQC